MSYPFKVTAPTNDNEQSAGIEQMQFDTIVSYLKKSLGGLPDPRVGHNSSFTMEDIVLAAFSVFFTQSASFLAYQNQMQQTKGKNNADSLFQLSNIPCDNQIRNVLDCVPPEHLNHIFNYIYQQFYITGNLKNYQFLNGNILIALDGVCYHSSSKIKCQNCKTTNHRNGDVTYSHSAITPVIVAPNNPNVISLPPEFITPQDGHDKQDSEHAAVKRWLKTHAETYREQGVTFLGDDLFSCQPICEAFLNAGCHFVLTCKPGSHETLYEWLDDFERLKKIECFTINRKHGKKKFIDTYRFINQMPIRDSDDALFVNWCELITTDDNGNILHKSSFITDHELDENNVVDVVVAGRTRWKIENENNNTLKTKGYNLEHNFGHGKKYLSQTLISLNLLSFLYHTVLNLTDLAYQLIREKLPTRKSFFDDLRALTRYMHFKSWRAMMEFMMDGLEIIIPDTG